MGIITFPPPDTQCVSLPEGECRCLLPHLSKPTAPTSSSTQSIFKSHRLSPTRVVADLSKLRPPRPEDHRLHLIIVSLWSVCSRCSFSCDLKILRDWAGCPIERPSVWVCLLHCAVFGSVPALSFCEPGINLESRLESNQRFCPN